MPELKERLHEILFIHHVRLQNFVYRRTHAIQEGRPEPVFRRQLNPPSHTTSNRSQSQLALQLWPFPADRIIFTEGGRALRPVTAVAARFLPMVFGGPP